LPVSSQVDAIKSHYKGFYVPAESMLPTLEVEDKFLGKMSKFGEIRRGDIMIVRAEATDYVKRAVGLPGDTVALKNGTVIINGTEVAQRLLETKPGPDSLPDSGEMQILAEQFPGEAQPHRIIDQGYTESDDRLEVKLGPREYFFLGDNRDRSADSRYEPNVMGLGIVSRERIVGRALFRYWRTGTGYKEGSI
jgi:signal peptidase I